MRLQTPASLIVAVVCCLSFAGAGMAGANAERAETPVTLSSLDEGCTLHERWVGMWPVQTSGLMLRCNGGGEFLVLQPNNLLGHVHIRTPEQALEFVRLFSTDHMWHIVDLKGMVEVMPRPADAPEDYFFVSPAVFRKRKLTAPNAHSTGTSPCRPTLDLVCGEEFVVERTVVLIDDPHVYSIVESVTERGFYHQISKKVLLNDAIRIGITHFGDL